LRGCRAHSGQPGRTSLAAAAPTPASPVNARGKARLRGAAATPARPCGGNPPNPPTPLAPGSGPGAAPRRALGNAARLPPAIRN
jgi:hypothetical protein